MAILYDQSKYHTSQSSYYIEMLTLIISKSKMNTDITKIIQWLAYKIRMM